MSEMASTEPVLIARGIEKTFDRTRALVQGDLELRAGEVHGLLGANGAGKSTLSKVISGHVVRDAGEIHYKGQLLNYRSTRGALDAGIAIVMQETSLAPDLTVLENIFLPELGRSGRLSYARLRRRAGEILASLGQEHVLPLDEDVSRLSAAQRQLVEIAKALALDADLIIFDEPTASLSPGEVELLFDVMTRLRDGGRSLVFVSHRLEEVFAITDRVTIMREGRTVVASRDTASLTQTDLIRHMVGQELGAIYSVPGIAALATTGKPVVLSVENLSAPPAVRNVSFQVRRGEILGLGGLVGAGRSETAEAIFGLRPRSGGMITIDGKNVDPRKPMQAVKAGIGFVAEDRRVQNIVPDLTVKENLLLAHLGAHRGFGLAYGSRDARIAELLDSLGLPPERLLDGNMLNFSGGMQQKIIIARWLLLDPRILILDEPTKGVDIGTRTSIYAILRQIAERGVAVVLISSDFEELLGISERIVVISDGTSVADLPSALLDVGKLTLLAAPRTSTRRNTALLNRLTATHGGVAFWILLDGDRLICLNMVVADATVRPGFEAGEAKAIEDTAIPLALGGRHQQFVGEADGSRSTLLVPMRSHRGHDLGWIGLTLPAAAGPAALEEIRHRVESMDEAA
jgi:ribose transport system ATP-binding protein/rhamnose transport system ATP-binding protein